MYASFFGLRELPFNNTPDPRFFFSTPDHEEALASLVYAVSERKGFVLLTGEVGAGKTLVSRMMLRHFGSRIVFANIHHAVSSGPELIEAVCQELELTTGKNESAVNRVRLLHDFLLEQFSRNIPAVLVLDEAQNLPVHAYEHLRMIGNLEADEAKLLQIIIVGQPELRRLFATPQLRQLRQRVFRAFHLTGMNRPTSEAYVRHRLKVAGAAEAQLFDASALDRIHHHAKGLPRLINTICDNSLLSAYSADRKTVDGGFVDSVVGQMLSMGGGPEPSEPLHPDEPEFCDEPLERLNADVAADARKPRRSETEAKEWREQNNAGVETENRAVASASRARSTLEIPNLGTAKRKTLNHPAATHKLPVEDDGRRRHQEASERSSRIAAAAAAKISNQHQRWDSFAREAQHKIDEACDRLARLTRIKDCFHQARANKQTAHRSDAMDDAPSLLERPHGASPSPIGALESMESSRLDVICTRLESILGGVHELIGRLPAAAGGTSASQRLAVGPAQVERESGVQLDRDLAQVIESLKSVGSKS